MAVFFVHAPDIPSKDSRFEKSVSIVEPGPASHTSAQSPKYREIWKKSIHEDYGILKCYGAFTECTLFQGKKTIGGNSISFWEKINFGEIIRDKSSLVGFG